jgi:putative transposase
MDQGCYIASESSFYRVMKKYNQAAHRGRSKVPTKRPVSTHKATGPNQVWMWDITWLPGPAKGVYYYLYMIMDLYSRKIVGWEVWENESSENASKLVRKAVYSENILLKKEPLVLHSDNGSPMKGASLLATLYRLGIVSSKSRPRVSNDNPYIESLFRTVKYMPVFPHKGFEMLNKAREWVHTFVQYYNSEHRHSSLKFVTPVQRHTGEDIEILKRRKEICEKAKAQTPERWRGNTRNWDLEDEVWLNPVTKRKESNVI